jgi:hypothetical protein
MKMIEAFLSRQRPNSTKMPVLRDTEQCIFMTITYMKHKQKFAKKKTRLREQIEAKMGLYRLQLEPFFQCKLSILSSRGLVRGSKKAILRQKATESKSARITSFFWRYLRKNREILW